MKRSGIVFILLVLLSACTVKPRAIVEGSDVCEYCKMTVMEKQFAAEFVTAKGRFYTFDDIKCMKRYVQENAETEKDIKYFFVTDFNQPEQLFRAEKGFYFTTDGLRTPMNGNTIAFSSKESLDQVKSKLDGKERTWDDVMK